MSRNVYSHSKQIFMHKYVIFYRLHCVVFIRVFVCNILIVWPYTVYARVRCTCYLGNIVTFILYASGWRKKKPIEMNWMKTKKARTLTILYTFDRNLWSRLWFFVHWVYVHLVPTWPSASNHTHTHFIDYILSTEILNNSNSNANSNKNVQWSFQKKRKVVCFYFILFLIFCVYFSWRRHFLRPLQSMCAQKIITLFDNYHVFRSNGTMIHINSMRKLDTPKEIWCLNGIEIYIWVFGKKNLKMNSWVFV